MAASSNQFRSTDLTTPTSGGANRFAHAAANPFAPQDARRRAVVAARRRAAPWHGRRLHGVAIQCAGNVGSCDVHQAAVHGDAAAGAELPQRGSEAPILGSAGAELLDFMAAAFTLWAVGHFFGASEILDAAVLLFGALGVSLMGRSLLEGIEDLFTAIDLVRTADNDRDLDEAASEIAACVAAVGTPTLMALLIHNIAKVGWRISRQRARVCASRRPDRRRRPSAVSGAAGG